MSTEQEALRLADALKGHAPMATRDEAAAMLRKLVAEREADREAMRMALEALKVLTDEPTPAYVAISKADAAIKALEQRVGES